MKKQILVVVFLSLLPFIAATAQKSMTSVVNESLVFAEKQYLLMAQSLKDRPYDLPRSIDKDGRLITCNSKWWTSGFFPGTLWYLFENSKNAETKRLAQSFTQRVADQQYTTNNHDVGFMIYCSFGNGYRITGDSAYKTVIINAAQSLSTRFRPTVGCIRSWDWGQWQYPVIIDNMMNLELMFEASRLANQQRFANIAVSHANTTMANHFRPNASCYHVVSYDTLTGKAIQHQTRQGFADESSWARGQAWALYGYTMCYRETHDAQYLQHAKKIAKFILENPRLPEDKIPYWDFDDPAIPNTFRDASAGALICSALIELSQYVNKKASAEYLKVAEKQLRALSSPAYRADIGTNGNFILKHSVGSKPENSEVDVPLSYADYYYVEALLRYKKLILKKK
jgi:rhamnogalacturonyl hydrolase YesR